MSKKAIIFGCFILAAVLITVGVIKHQQADVMTKAINICLECVGIG